MNKIVISLFVPLLLACGAPSNNQDPRVEEYVTQFEKMYQVTAGHIAIAFVDSFTVENAPTTAVGLCHSSRTILFKASFWEKATEIQRQYLVFHELGHCALNREHKVDVYDDNCGKSIMHPNVQSSYCLTKHHVELLEELAPMRGK